MTTAHRATPDALRAGLARAGSVAAAAEQLMEVMVAAGFELPSIYLERGGRLRCTAQRGYWQVYDGLAPGAGVLGTTFATGATQVVRDLDGRVDYIRAVTDVAAEICVPLRLGGRVAGALNVECKRQVDSEDVATIADGQELGRHTLTAALTVSGMSSAVLIPGDGSRPPVLAEGPLAPLLLDLPVADAQQLVLVDQRPQPGLERVIPLLEMLAATAAAMLAAATASAALQLSERELAHQATHDTLTGLANRARLLEEIVNQLSDRRGRARLVVLFVDLDGFKEVNDRHGHRAGDRLLVSVADRLRHAARGTDLVARLGGDEFVVLCPGVESVGEATAVGDRVLERLAAPFRLRAIDVSVTACIGIAPADGHTDPEDLLAAADRAMYAAKRAGAGTWVLAEALT